MFIKTIAFTTSLARFAIQPATPTTDVAVAELVHEAHFTQEGLGVDLYVTRDAHGDLLAEATLLDPEHDGTEVDVWTDGVTVWWDGTVDGERVAGSAPAVEFSDPKEAAFCLTPVTAIVCIGAAALLLAGGCRGSKGFCVADSSEPPGGAGGVPDDPDQGQNGGDAGEESGGGGDGEP